MKSIEQLKVDLTLKLLAGKDLYTDIRNLPKDDDLRTFMCSLKPQYAYWYSLYVDKCPRDDTRIASCKHLYYKALYVAAFGE